MSKIVSMPIFKEVFAKSENEINKLGYETKKISYSETETEASHRVTVSFSFDVKKSKEIKIVKKTDKDSFTIKGADLKKSRLNADMSISVLTRRVNKKLEKSRLSVSKKDIETWEGLGVSICRRSAEVARILGLKIPWDFSMNVPGDAFDRQYELLSGLMKKSRVQMGLSRASMSMLVDLNQLDVEQWESMSKEDDMLTVILKWDTLGIIISNGLNAKEARLATKLFNRISKEMT